MRLTVAARQDLEDASRWYDRAEPGLGEELLSAVDAALDVLVDHATAFPVVHGRAHRLSLRRFPYGIYYLLGEQDVVIIGCFHARRDPGAWIERADEHDEA